MNQKFVQIYFQFIILIFAYTFAKYTNFDSIKSYQPLTVYILSSCSTRTSQTSYSVNIIVSLLLTIDIPEWNTEYKCQRMGWLSTAFYQISVSLFQSRRRVAVLPYLCQISLQDKLRSLLSLKFYHHDIQVKWDIRLAGGMLSTISRS